MKKACKKNKVLIALHRFAIGGAETQALYLGIQLRNKGYEVIFGAFGTEMGEGFDRFFQSGFTCLRWGFQEKLILRPALGIKGWLRKYKYVISLIFKVRKMNCDVIIPFTFPPNLIFCNYFRFMGVKTCLWNQRDEGRLFKGTREEIYCLENSSYIVSNSIEGKIFLEKYTQKRINLISNGIDLNRFSEIYPDFSSNRIIMIGNIHGYKDHLTLLKAWKLVLLHFPEFKLVLAGRKGLAYSELSDFVRHQDLEQSIEFLGEVNDIPTLLKSCLFAVFSSENEGVPNGVLEPMAAGFAIIATNIEGIREALGDKYPFLVRPKDPKEFASKICELLGNLDTLKSIGEVNQARVRKFYSIERMGNHFHYLLNS